MDQLQDAPDEVREESQPFIGRWNRLVSTTNWEKGRIICEWRAALLAAAAPAAQSSDEAWARLVGGVSSQHVGRLRRVWERYGQSGAPAPQLYWSHYQATLDWNDAELWLEGAALEGWSVAEMRRRRWEAQGAPPDEKPRDEDIYVGQFDDDAPAEGPPAVVEAGRPGDVRAAADDAAAPSPGAGDDEAPPFDEAALDEFAAATAALVDQPQAAAPFASLPDLPADLAEAVEQMKLAILRHKAAGWRELSPDDMLAALEALRDLVLAPAEA